MVPLRTQTETEKAVTTVRSLGSKPARINDLRAAASAMYVCSGDLKFLVTPLHEPLRQAMLYIEAQVCSMQAVRTLSGILPPGHTTWRDSGQGAEEGNCVENPGTCTTPISAYQLVQASVSVTWNLRPKNEGGRFHGKAICTYTCESLDRQT